ncbi:MAG TPA: ferrochelatase [Vicinamibacterales bacterium]|nr:ferrochelatase [Vicinamibacterales bacterium]
MRQPFDAVILIAFGGPLGPGDIRPFLGNVLRGRRVAPERVDEVARHYELFNGVSPITELTRRQAEGLRAALEAGGSPLPVYMGMRNWHPYLRETMHRMAEDGVRRAIGFIMAAHRSYSSCTQYRENVRDARAELLAAGVAAPELTYVNDWHAHAGYVETCARHIVAAIERLPPTLRPHARIVFTAHSIPVEMAERYPYREQLLETARMVAGRINAADWALVYQSRSGRPEDPWLGPDICDYLRAERAQGLRSAVLAPVGFVSDHIEVLYDLDTEAASVCRQIGVEMARAEAANADAVFVQMMADVVHATSARYADGRPLPLAMPAAAR